MLWSVFFLGKNSKFSKNVAIINPNKITCLVSHLILSQVRGKKGTILFCLLEENQGVPGHGCPALRGKLCTCYQSILWNFVKHSETLRNFEKLYLKLSMKLHANFKKLKFPIPSANPLLKPHKIFRLKVLVLYT